MSAADKKTGAPGGRRIALWILLATGAALLIWLAPPEKNAGADVAAVVNVRGAAKANGPLGDTGEVHEAGRRAPATPGRGPSATGSKSLSARIAALPERTRSQEPGVVLFQTDTFRAPAAPPPPALRAPRALAPAFPYAFLGALQDGPTRTVFLSLADRVVSVREADTIDGLYRVTRLTPDELDVLYLPLNEPQVISLKSDPR